MPGRSAAGGGSTSAENRVSGRVIAGGLPGVQEGPPSHGWRAQAREEPDLVGPRGGVEVTAQDRDRWLALGLREEFNESADLLLAIGAPGWIGNEMSRREQDRAAWPLDDRPERDGAMLHAYGTWNRSAFDLGQGPAGEHGHPLIVPSSVRSAAKACCIPRRSASQAALIAVSLLPDLLETHEVGIEISQRANDGPGAGVPVSEAPPEVPGHDPQPRFDERAVGRRRSARRRSRHGERL